MRKVNIILLETSLLRIPRGCANSVKATMFMVSPSKGLELSATEAEWILPTLEGEVMTVAKSSDHDEDHVATKQRFFGEKTTPIRT